MTRMIHVAAVLVLIGQSVSSSQAPDAARVLAAMREALGGEQRLTALKSVAIEGRVTRPRPDGSSGATDVEMVFALPDKFVTRDVIAQLGPVQITRRSGFNGADPIEEVDAPPSMGGGMRVMQLGPNAVTPGGQATPEQLEAQMKVSLLASRREFARLSLGMFGGVSAAYPVEFAYAGQAESPDGKADILQVTSKDGFAARLFVDAASHLPLMLTWMDKEPLRMMRDGRSGGAGGGNVQVVTGGDGHGRSPEQIEQMRKEMEERMKEAEANRKIVEYRLFYGEYKTIDGVRLPSTIQRMVDGTPTEEIALERITVNGKIDAGTFKGAR